MEPPFDWYTGEPTAAYYANEAQRAERKVEQLVYTAYLVIMLVLLAVFV